MMKNFFSKIKNGGHAMTSQMRNFEKINRNSRKKTTSMQYYGKTICCIHLKLSKVID